MCTQYCTQQQYSSTCCTRVTVTAKVWMVPVWLSMSPLCLWTIPLLLTFLLSSNLFSYLFSILSLYSLSSLSHFSPPPPLYFVYSSLQLTYVFPKPLLLQILYITFMRRSFKLNAKSYDTSICNIVLYHFYLPAFLP